MDKKTIFLELPAEIVDRIDQENTTGDRSAYVSDLLHAKFKDHVTSMDPTDLETDITSRMHENTMSTPISEGKIKVLNKLGQQLGVFDINTIDGFEQLSQKISSISEDPIVRMRARRWR
ncbi:hypothetical protein B6U98_00070 [Thermoplasmatales archaeon ex4572_165]|nr:MAG: hypothetical protein B6U98_00070 [Thermoplasmatales archaeon ex4572_165]